LSDGKTKIGYAGVIVLDVVSNVIFLIGVCWKWGAGTIRSE